MRQPTVVVPLDPKSRELVRNLELVPGELPFQHNDWSEDSIRFDARIPAERIEDMFGSRLCQARTGGPSIPLNMMDDFDILQLKRNPQWRALLQVYHDRQQEMRAASPDSDGWVARPAEFEGIEPDQVSSIHGKLIAFGFLKFDVSGRDVGVRYQLTHEGRRALTGETAPVADDVDFAESA
jgi:hypothetical protein